MYQSTLIRRLRNSTLKKVVTLLLPIFLASWSCDNRQRDETKTKPEVAALIGTWIPDTETLKHMREAGGYNVSNKTELILEANNTYAMSNMPDWLWLDEGRSHQTLRSEKGTWEITLDGARENWIILLRSEVRARGIALHGQKPPHKLRFSVGNIDTNPQSMTFLRE